MNRSGIYSQINKYLYEDQCFILLFYHYMQNTIYNKNEGFRKAIRRQQIEKYKSKIREKILSGNVEQQTEMRVQDHSQQQFYHKILNHHNQQNLLRMSQQQLSNHMQVLLQIIFLQDNQKFVPYFDRLIRVLIDFYQQLLRNISEIAIEEIKSTNCNLQDGEVIEMYAMHKLLGFIDADKMNKLFAGIFYQIRPQQNKEYLNKAVIIVMRQIKFIFKDHFSLNSILEIVSPMGLGIELSKSINKSILLTVLMNISFSQNEEIIRVLLNHNVYQILTEIVQTFGMDINSLQSLAGLYSNSIQTLYSYAVQNYNNSAIHKYSQAQEYQYSLSNDKSYHLYIPLFQLMINLQQQKISQRMVIVGAYISKAITQLQLNQEYVTNLIIILMRNIIKQNKYIEGSQLLFIEFAKVKDFSKSNYYLWLLDYLNIIIDHQNTVYYTTNASKFKSLQFEEEYKDDDKFKKVGNIGQLISSCQFIIATKCNQFDYHLIDLHKGLVESLFKFWSNDQLINGQRHFLHFVNRAIEVNQTLADFIIIQKFEQQVIQLILTSIQNQHQNNEILMLIFKVLERIEFILSDKERKQYFEDRRRQWSNIKVFIEVFEQTMELQSLQHFVESMLKTLEQNDI